MKLIKAIVFAFTWLCISGIAVAAQERWITLPNVTMTQPVAIQPVVLPPVDDSRLVLWNSVSDLGKWSVQSQMIAGGDDACFRFTGELSIIHESEVPSRCLTADARFLFAIICQPPELGISFRQTVVRPEHGPICTKVIP